jgi:prefoldin subunit 5
MAGSNKEIADLIGQHDAIRAQMKFLTESLKELVVVPESGNKGFESFKKTIQSYSYTLRDLRTGVINHIDLDEKIFKTISPGVAEEQFNREHVTIKQQIDRAIKMVDEEIDRQLTEEELSQRVSEISKTINRIRRLIRDHTEKEDQLLKSV